MESGKYDSDWMLDIVDRVLILDDPIANKLYDTLYHLMIINDGIREEYDDHELFVSGRDFTPAEEKTFNDTAEKLASLLNKLENGRNTKDQNQKGQKIVKYNLEMLSKKWRQFRK